MAGCGALYLVYGAMVGLCGTLVLVRGETVSEGRDETPFAPHQPAGNLTSYSMDPSGDHFVAHSEIFFNQLKLREQLTNLTDDCDLRVHECDQRTQDVQKTIREQQKTILKLVNTISESKAATQEHREINHELQTSNQELLNSILEFLNSNLELQNSSQQLRNSNQELQNSKQMSATKIQELEKNIERLNRTNRQLEASNQQLQNNTRELQNKSEAEEAETEAAEREKATLQEIIQDLEGEVQNLRSLMPPPHDCSEAMTYRKTTTRRVHTIYPQGEDGRSVEVWCQWAEGRAWTVFLARDNSVVPLQDFNKPWTFYKNGFGNLHGEYWLGNEHLHHLTARGLAYTLRVEATNMDNESRSGEWPSFRVEDEASRYMVALGSMTAGNISDRLSDMDGAPFSTVDRDHDSNSMANCADEIDGGWWYTMCGNVFPTSCYTNKNDILKWPNFRPHDNSHVRLSRLLMMVTPAV